MKQNAKGFSIVEILLVGVGVLLVAFIGYYVWSQNNSSQPKDNSNNSKTSTQATVVKTNANMPVPETNTTANGLKTVTKNGMTVSYPASWDEIEDYMKLNIAGKADGDTINVGFGAPYGFKYISGTNWKSVNMIDGTVDEKNPPKTAPANVKGAASTIIISSGDGGCGGRKIGIAYQGKVYSVSLPWICDNAGDPPVYTGIPEKEIDDNLVKVIESITIN